MRGLRGGAIGGALALLAVTPSHDVAAAQVPGEYTGTVPNPFGTQVPGYSGNVVLNVSNDATAVTGRMVVLFDGSIEFDGDETPVCFVIEATFLASPLAISNGQAAGDVRVVQDIADGSCAARTPDQPVESTVPIEIQFQGNEATGRLIFRPFEVPEDVNFAFTATGRGGGGGGGGDQASTSTTLEGFPGIEELFAGAALTSDTRRRLAELQGCRERGPDGRCRLVFDDQEEVEGFITNVQQQLRVGTDTLFASASVGAASFLAALRDARGEPLVPNMQRMLPVIIELRRLAEVNEEFDFELTARRLIGLLVTEAIQARE